MAISAVTAHEKVRAIVEEILADTPDYLVDLAVRGTAGSQAVDVFIDSDVELPVGRLADINREVGFLLETEDILSGSFRLNVSSPGLDKPLRLPRQYRKNTGRMLRVHFQKPDGTGFTEISGSLEEATEKGIRVRFARGQERRIAYTDILWAKVQLPW